MRFAFLTPGPEYPEAFDWAFDAQAAVLRADGDTVDAVRWTEAVDLAGYDLILPLVAWGYHLRHGQWLELLDRFERERQPVANSPALLRWSSHKSYLAELGDKGIPTVPTLSVEACSEGDLMTARRRFGTGQLVVKPPISASADGTFRLAPDDPLPEETRGRPTIIQPMIEAIAHEGEYALMLFDGAFSHSVVKRPKPGDFRVQPHLGGTADACDPPDGAEALAKAALAAAPAAATYARVDIIRDDSGVLRVMELELVEPSLFLPESPDRGAAFARAVRSAAERARQ
jgi:glutathione synthase/RimK-type ligase-like ATP-grasp enzyme